MVNTRLSVIVLFCGPLIFGQRVFYNADLDKKAQDAATVAKALASDSLSAQEVANLATIEKQQLDTALQASWNTMRLQIQSFDTWANVYSSLTSVVTAIGTFPTVSVDAKQLKQRQKDVKTSAADLKAAVDAKQAAAPASSAVEDASGFVDGVVAHISDVDDLLKLVDQISGSTNLAKSSAVSKVEDGLKELDDLLKTAAAAIKAARDVKVDPRTLMPSPESLKLAVLAAETDSLKERIAIRARSDLQNGEVLHTASSTQKLMEKMLDKFCTSSPCGQPLSQSTRLVSETLGEGDIQRKEDLLRVLYQAASVAAQNQTAATVATTLDSIAWRRFQLRRNAIYNGAYEQTLQLAGQRISAYYATGIKPSQIAQLLYYLSGIVSLPAIAF